MGIATGTLILHEVKRFLQLADVVVVATHTGQEPVGSDGIAGALAQVGHRQTVGVGAWDLRGQTTQQGVIRVRKLEQGHGGSDACPPLEDRQREKDECCRNRGVAGAPRHAEPKLSGRPASSQLYSKGYRCERCNYQRRGPEDFRPATDGPNAQGGGNAPEQRDIKGIRPAVGNLEAQESRQHHRRHHGNPPVEQDSHDDRGKRNRNKLGAGMYKPESPRRS